MEYFIKVLDNETGDFLWADEDGYSADNEIGALHLFAETRKNDVGIEDVQIVNDDPENFLLKIKGWVVNDDKFEVMEDVFQFIAVQEE
jgi:hypothetical protein